MSKIFPDKRNRETLDQFYHRFIKPTKQEVKEIKRTVGKAVSFLEREFPHDGYTVKEVLTAGSVGKGTNVHGDADIDLVFFVNGLESVGDLRQKLPDFLSHLMDRAECEDWLDIEARKTTNSSFSCKLEGYKLDILPAFDVCWHYDSNEDIYTAMSNRQKRKDLNMNEIAQEFSASLSPLNLDFIRDLPRQVKKVIRLLKYWKREHQLYIRSCALELLAVHVWRKLGEEDLETTEFIREVMKRLENCGALRIAFNDNYDTSDYRDDFEAPYILDPANPFRNTLRGLDIEDVCEEAKDVLWHL